MSTATDGDWLYSKNKLCAIDFNIPDNLHGSDIREISFIDVSDLTNPAEEEDPDTCDHGYAEIRSKLPMDGLEADEIVLTDLRGSPSRETGKGAAFLFSSTKDRVYDQSSIFCDLEKYKLGFKHALKLVGHRYKWEINTCPPDKDSTQDTTVNVYSNYTDWLANEIFNYVLNGMKLHFESEDFGIKEDYCLSNDQKEAFYRGFAASVDEIALYATGLSSIVLYTASQEQAMRNEHDECPAGAHRGENPSTSRGQPAITAGLFSYASNIAHQAVDTGTKEASQRLASSKRPISTQPDYQQQAFSRGGAGSEVFEMSVEPPPTPEDQGYGPAGPIYQVPASPRSPTHHSPRTSANRSFQRVPSSPPVQPLSRTALVNQINADLMNRDHAYLDQNENAISRKSSAQNGGQCCSESVYLLVKYLFLEFRPTSACCLWPADKVSGFAMTETDFAALLRWGIMRYASEIASRLIDSILRQLYTTLQGNTTDNSTVCLVTNPAGAARQRRELLKLYIKLYSERLSLQIIKEVMGPCRENRRINEFMFLPTPCVSRPSTAQFAREDIPTYLINKCSDTFGPPKVESICPSPRDTCPVTKFSESCTPRRTDGPCPESIEDFCKRKKMEEECRRDLERTCAIRKQASSAKKFDETCTPRRTEGPCPESIEDFCKRKKMEEECQLQIEDTCPMPCPPEIEDTCEVPDIEDTCDVPVFEDTCPLPRIEDTRIPPTVEEICPPQPKVEKICPPQPKVEEMCPPEKTEDVCITTSIQDILDTVVTDEPALSDTSSRPSSRPKTRSSTCVIPVMEEEEPPLPPPFCPSSDAASVIEGPATPQMGEDISPPSTAGISSSPRSEGSACSAPIMEEEPPPVTPPVCEMSVVPSVQVTRQPTPLATRSPTPHATRSPTPHATRSPTPRATRSPSPLATRPHTPLATRPPSPLAIQEGECIIPPEPVKCERPQSLLQAAIMPTLSKELPPDIPCQDIMHDFNENLINNMLMQEEKCDPYAVCTCPVERQHAVKQAVFSLDQLKSELDPAIKFYCSTVSDFIKDNPGGLIEMVANQSALAGIEVFVDHLTQTGVTLESITEAQALVRPMSPDSCRPRSATARKTWTVRITSASECVEKSEVLVSNQSTAFDEHARQLQAVLQWAAASELGVPRMYFNEMDDGLMARLPEVAHRAQNNQNTVGDLLQSVVRYHEEQIPDMLLDWLCYNL